MNKKLKKAIILVFICIIATIFGLYFGDKQIRTWANVNVLKTQISSNTLPKIMLPEDNSVYTYAYSEYVVLLDNNTLTMYNSNGKKVTDITVQVSVPKFTSCGDYLVVADDLNSNLYLIHNSSLQWSKQIVGNISQITVNEKGAVGISITGTTYKTVIVMYDITGSELFKSYLSTDAVVDLSISKNNKYLSFGSINTSGTVVKSLVKTIDVAKAKNSAEGSIIHTCTKNDELITKLQYNNNKLTALYDTGIYKIDGDSAIELLKLDETTSFSNINVKNRVCAIKEPSEALYNKYELQFLSVSGHNEKAYEIDNSVKNMYSKENFVCLDMGNEIRVVNTSAWLKKTITLNQNVKDIVIGTKVIGLVYRDRIEIIKI